MVFGGLGPGYLCRNRATQMVKKDIAHRLHREAGIPDEQAASILDWLLEFFKSTLQRSEQISIPKFGVFTVRTKAARRGRNPRIGEEIINLATESGDLSAKPPTQSCGKCCPGRTAQEVTPAEGEVSGPVA
jgi:DNA-binding protein HU-beta